MGMGLNWPAIVVAGLADWILGAVWFTVFANQWRAGLRMTSDEMQTYMTHPNFWPYIISAMCSIILAYVIARLLGSAPGHSLFRGISIGMLVGLATAVAMVTEMIFEYRAHPFVLISAAYPFLGCILMGIIVGAWRPKAAKI